MLDESNETRTKEGVEALEKENYPDGKRVLVTIPRTYFESQLCAQWCAVLNAIALRLAQLWLECLDDEEKNPMVDNGQYEEIEYQILMFGQEEFVFQSALPTPRYEEYATVDHHVAATTEMAATT